MTKLKTAGVIRKNTLDRAAKILAESNDISLLYSFIALYAKHKTEAARKYEKEQSKIFKKMDRDIKRSGKAPRPLDDLGEL